MSEDASRKRPRTTSTSPGDSDVITRSPTLWFSDGNIVLQVEGTQFRVHRGVLARHSPVLRGLFEVPQPLGEEAVEGCPFVILQDSKDEWNELLLYIYDGPRACRIAGKYKMTALIAMLRLGDKYEMEILKQEALKQLSKAFPSSDHTAFFNPKRLDNIINDEESLCKIATFAIEMNMQRLLPSILQLFVVYIHGIPKYPHICKSRLISHLDKNNVVAVQRLLAMLEEAKPLIARDVLLLQYPWLTLQDATCPQCIKPYKCKERLAVYRHHQLHSQLESILPPFINRDDKARVSEEYKALCEACVVAIHEGFEEGAIKIYDKFPTYFGLPSWRRLTNGIK